MDLGTLLNWEDLLEAISQNKDYYKSENGLTVKSNSTDNSLSLSITYNSAKKEANNFQKYLERLDDSLFTEVCEAIGNSELKRLQDCVNSNDLETVRAGINKFKSYLTLVVNTRINHLKSLLTETI